LFTTRSPDFITSEEKSLDDKKEDMSNVVYERKKIIIKSIRTLSQDTRFTNFLSTILSDTLNSNKKTTEEAFRKSAIIAINEAAQT
jgi:hypothetical protein